MLQVPNVAYRVVRAQYMFPAAFQTRLTVDDARDPSREVLLQWIRSAKHASRFKSSSLEPPALQVLILSLQKREAFEAFVACAASTLVAWKVSAHAYVKHVIGQS